VVDVTIGEQAYSGSSSFQVPTGKECTFEYFSTTALAPAGQKVVLVDVGIIEMNSPAPAAAADVPPPGPETTAGINIPPAASGIIKEGSLGNFDLFIGNALTRLYARGGDTVSVTAHRSGDSSGQGAIRARITISGFCLVDMN
jgi:hypothetical protein